MRRHIGILSTAWLMCITSTLLIASTKDLFRYASPETRRAISKNYQMATSMISSGGTITGMLVNLSPEACESAVVYAWTNEPSEVFYEDSLTGKGVSPVSGDGIYSISGLAPGNYYIQATADGYLDMYYDGQQGTIKLDDAQILSVEGDAVIENINICMTANPSQNGRISGCVVDALTLEPVQNAQVSVFCTHFYCFNFTTTDENGEYTIGNLTNDTSYVQVTAKGYIMQYYHNAQTIDDATLISVTDSAEVTNIDFKLSRGNSITGTITDSSGMPLEDVFVQAISEPNDSIDWIEPVYDRSAYYVANTDTNGIYTITGLPDGEYFIKGDYYTMWGSHSAYYPGVTDPDEAIPISVSENIDMMDINFQIYIHSPVGVIEGQVVDTKGRPVIGAVISLGAYPPWRSCRCYWESALTDSLGRYRLEKIPNDQYTVECNYNSHWGSVYYFWPGTTNLEEAQPIEISPENSLWSDIDFQLPVTLSQASISGQVRATDGHPLANAQLRLLPTEDATNDALNTGIRIWDNTDSNGDYKINHIPTGTYVLQCQFMEAQQYGEQWYDHAENNDNATVILIHEDTRLTRIDFDLDIKPVYGFLDGVVSDQENHPIQNAYVEVIPNYTFITIASDYDRTNVPLHTTTDENGRYIFPRLYHNNYRLVAYANGGYAYYPNAIVLEQSQPVAISGGDSVTADFKVRISEYCASISGHIISNWTGWTVPCEDSAEASLGKVTEVGLETFVVTAKPVITIQSWPESERVYSALTSWGGHYLLTCPPGEYIVQAFSSDCFPSYYENVFEFSKAKIVRTSEEDPAEDINIILTPKLYWLFEDSAYYRGDDRRIYGSIEDENGDPVAGATVFLYNISGNPIFSATTNDQGCYDISGLQNGDYYIQALKAGVGSVFNGNVGSIAEAAPVNLDQTEQEVNLVFSVVADISSDKTALPRSIQLIGNCPNPFNPQTSIRFALPKQMHIRLTIYNALGQEIMQITDENFKAGEHQLLWTGEDRNGNLMPSGLYFYRLQAGSQIQTCKMILMR
ncbi:carboxypeptidase regulatory-like domain-containing protein [bacterium]|nr:carboxypeptidase regulatory-like domain-containing protein [bacterium]